MSRTTSARVRDVAALAACLLACEAEPEDPTVGGLGDPCGHDYHCAGTLVCESGTCAVHAVADSGSDPTDASDDSPAACYGDSLTQLCDDEDDCCAYEHCYLFGGLDGARCTASCSVDADCTTQCCQDGTCVPTDYCPEPPGDPCSECLDACREAMLPSCCTGVGCICESAC